MSYEVEQKFRAETHVAVADQLARLGTKARPPETQVDAYFNHPARDFAQTGEAFRIRRHGARNALTYKGPRLAGPTKTRTEHEVGFEEGDEAYAKLRTTLLALGFRPVAEIRKVRIAHHLTHAGRDVEVVLDEVDGVGIFVEVEALARDESDLAAAQQAVLDLAGRLGLGTPEPRSYLRMWLETRAAATDS